MAERTPDAGAQGFAERPAVDVLDPAAATVEVEVVTVDDEGRMLGTAPRRAAHQGAGVRHLAVSVVLVDGAGRVLLQRRADTKPLFAGLWSNTVCTHPFPTEDPALAARRRLEEEMGLRCALTARGTFTYQAADPTSGLAENEFDHVFSGTTDEVPEPDPTEISEIRWMSVDDLATERRRRPELFTPWLGHVLRVAGLVPLADLDAPTPATPIAGPADRPPTASSSTAPTGAAS